MRKLVFLQAAQAPCKQLYWQPTSRAATRSVDKSTRSGRAGPKRRALVSTVERLPAPFKGDALKYKRGDLVSILVIYLTGCSSKGADLFCFCWCVAGGEGASSSNFDVFSLLLPKQTTDQLTRAYVKGRVLGSSGRPDTQEPSIVLQRSMRCFGRFVRDSEERVLEQVA